MNELAVQAANGTNSTSDRTAIQNEIKQLTTEIDRVAETTKFNETYLLKGDVKGSTKTITLKPHDAGLKGSMVYTEGATTAKFTVPELKESDTIMIGGKQYTIKGTENKDLDEILATDAYTLMAAELKKANEIGAEDTTKVEVNGAGPDFTIKLGQHTVAKPLAFNLHVGADADMTNKISVNIETMNSAYLGIKDLNVVDNMDVSPGAQATYAIDAIADAIQKVSDQRSALGAVQNRLEHTIKNLDNVVENTTAAESQIRDTDMASTMVEYTKNNILMQAGQSMLAQANQSTQGVMSLLQ